MSDRDEITDSAKEYDQNGEAMKLNATLDVDVIALQQDDEVTCLLTFEAPVPADQADRPGETLVVVVDRSGSMNGEPLEAVRSSLHALVGRVKPQDTFGVVVFDDQAAVAVPARPVRDHDLPTVHALIDGIQPGGMTDLSGGYLLGLQRGASASRRHGSHRAAAVRRSRQLRHHRPRAGGCSPAGARAERITTSTVGIGAGYDETLLSEVATSGSGSHRFAYTPDDAAAVVSEKAGDLLNKAIVNAFVRIKPTDPALLERIGTLHAVPRWIETDETGDKVIVIPLGDLYAGEQRELLVHFDVPAIAALGHHALATFTIDYVAMPDLVAQVVTWPVAVNVVPGDEASGRVPDPTVTTARLLARGHSGQEGGLGGVATRRLRHGCAADDRAVGPAGRGDAHDPGRRAPNAGRAAPGPPRRGAPATRRLARSAREYDTFMSRKSFMEDVAMESRGRNDAVRRDRSRGKRDF